MKFRNAAALMCAAMLIPSAAHAEDGVNIFVNGRPLAIRGFLSEGVTYLPLRAVSEALGASVNWDGGTMSAYVDSDDDTLTASIIAEASASTVAIVGNYKSDALSGTASDYNELTAHGSGVVIKSGGVILTNAHGVKDIQNLTVVFSDGESCAGQVQNIDESSDLAVVKVNRLGLKPIAFAQPENVFAGQSVIAIGAPLSLSMRNSATKGIISGTDVCLNSAYYPLLQTIPN